MQPYSLIPRVQKLLEYEETVAVAATEGIDLSNKEPVYKWSYIQAIFFTSTILTTIGKLGRDISTE